jgi:hypothetical protein
MNNTYQVNFMCIFNFNSVFFQQFVILHFSLALVILFLFSYLIIFTEKSKNSFCFLKRNKSKKHKQEITTTCKVNSSHGVLRNTGEMHKKKLFSTFWPKIIIFIHYIKFKYKFKIIKIKKKNLWTNLYIKLIAYVQWQNTYKHYNKIKVISISIFSNLQIDAQIIDTIKYIKTGFRTMLWSFRFLQTCILKYLSC